MSHFGEYVVTPFPSFFPPYVCYQAVARKLNLRVTCLCYGLTCPVRCGILPNLLDFLDQINKVHLLWFHH